MSRVQHSEVAERAFRTIRDSAPHLRIGGRPTWARDDDVVMTFPPQTGLAFEVSCYLSGDILNLTAHKFWGEWFPCDDETVAMRYVESVTSLLRGEWRLVEARRGDRLIWTKLQRPDGRKWRTVCSHRTLSLWPFPRKTISVISSTGAT